MMKKIIALVLALVMGLCFSTSSDAYAKEDAKKLDIVPVTMASAGGYSTAVIRSDGTLWMWGSEADIAPIDKSFNLSYDLIQSSPVKVMDDVLSVSYGGGCTAVIKNDYSLWMWGDAAGGNLGNGETEGVSSPTKIMDDVIMVSRGGSHTAAIKADGSLWLFGSNLHGQIGNGGRGNVRTYHDKNKNWTYSLQTVPEKVMDDVAYVDCGGDHTAAIKKDGTLWTWGYNMYGQLGNGKCAPGKAVVDFSADVYTPQMIMEDVAFVSCGDIHTAAIKKDGSLWVWGAGYLGAEGSTGYVKELTPVKIMDDVLYVNCSDEYTAVIKTDGSLWICGFDPVDGHLVAELTRAISSGCRLAYIDYRILYVIKDDGNLYGLGRKEYLGIGSNSSEKQTTLVKVFKNVMLPNTPSIVVKQEVDAAIEAGLVPKSLQKNYQKPITRGNLEKLLTQLIKKVGGKDINVREIVADSDGTFDSKSKVTESRFVTVIKRAAKALGIKYKSFGLKKTKTKLTTERAIAMIYRAYNMLRS